MSEFLKREDSVRKLESSLESVTSSETALHIEADCLRHAIEVLRTEPVNRQKTVFVEELRRPTATILQAFWCEQCRCRFLLDHPEDYNYCPRCSAEVVERRKEKYEGDMEQTQRLAAWANKLIEGKR